MATRPNKQEREYRESAVVDPKQKPKGNKLILVIVSAVLLLGAGAGGAGDAVHRHPHAVAAEDRAGEEAGNSAYDGPDDQIAHQDAECLVP